MNTVFLKKDHFVASDNIGVVYGNAFDLRSGYADRVEAFTGTRSPGLIFATDDTNNSKPSFRQFTHKYLPKTMNFPSGVTTATYSAVQVNEKGIVTAGAHLIEVGTPGQTTPSADLVIGGIFFQDVN